MLDVKEDFQSVLQHFPNIKISEFVDAFYKQHSRYPPAGISLLDVCHRAKISSKENKDGDFLLAFDTETTVPTPDVTKYLQSSYSDRKIKTGESTLL